MKVRFQADADLDARVIRGVKRQQPRMDFQTAHQAGLMEVSDAVMLLAAADSGRLLVTHDKRTCQANFFRFIANRTSPGVIIRPKDILIRIVGRGVIAYLGRQ